MLSLKGLRTLNRYQATLGHFGLSLLVLLILGYLVYFCWYPQPLFAIDAGWQGLRILAAVDFILGPLITFFIFNPKKKELVKDLAIIALIQVSALSYGVYHVYQSRPAIVVYADNQFRTVALSQLEFYNLPENLHDNIPLFGPSFYVLDIPRENIIDIKTAELTPENMDDVLNRFDEQRRPIQEASARKTAYYLLHERLIPYNSNLDIVFSNSITTESGLKFGDAITEIEKSDVRAYLKQNKEMGLSTTSIKGRFGYALTGLDQTGLFVTYIKGNYADTWLAE